MLIDTHTHIYFKDIIYRLEEVLKNAKENDVLSMIIVGINGASNKLAIELANKHSLYASVGIHPSDVDGSDFNEVLLYAKENRVVAIGETGIDLYWRQDNLELQQAIFIKHIELAIELNLPLIIHMRNSFEEIYDILVQYKGRVTGVFHCFTLGINEANKIIDLGFYLGIGGVLTFKNAKDLQDAVKKVPKDRLILETDSPYLAPTPFRGKINEPAYTKYVAIKLADLLNVSYEEIKTVTTNNTKRLFKIGDEKWKQQNYLIY